MPAQLYSDRRLTFSQREGAGVVIEAICTELPPDQANEIVDCANRFSGSFTREAHPRTDELTDFQLQMPAGPVQDLLCGNIRDRKA